jgi:hypothetical protein
MAVPITIIHKEIKNGISKGETISEKLNSSDIATNPLPASGLHILSHQLQR